MGKKKHVELIDEKRMFVATSGWSNKNDAVNANEFFDSGYTYNSLEELLATAPTDMELKEGDDIYVAEITVRNASRYTVEARVSHSAKVGLS